MIFIMGKEKSLIQPLDFFLLPLGSSPRLLPQAWTLSIEIACSLSIPLLIFFAKNRIFVIFLVLLTTSYFFNGAFQYIFHFSLGYLLYRHPLNLKRSIKLISFVLGIAFYTTNLTIAELYKLDTKTTYLLTGLGSFLILTAAISSQKLKTILSHKYLIFCGKISFSVYLVHYFIIVTLVKNLITPFATSIPHALLWPLGLIIVTCAVIVVGAAYHRWVEVPLIFWGKLTVNKITQRGI